MAIANDANFANDANKTMKSLIGEIRTLPKKPGIYFFKSNAGQVLYVGKATSLRDRVKSYFPVKGRGLWIEQMVREAMSVDYKICDSATAALLLEAVEIQKVKPKYNSRLRDDKSFLYIVVSNQLSAASRKNGAGARVWTARKAEAEEYLKVSKVEPLNNQGSTLKSARVFGPFPSSFAVRQVLKVIRPIFPFRSCKTLPKKPCLYFALGLCPGECENTKERPPHPNPPPRGGRERVGVNSRGLIRFLSGNVGSVVRGMSNAMKGASKARDFERAATLRDRIAAVKHIGEISMANIEVGPQISKSRGTTSILPARIEAYDISHISGAHAVGSMVVFSKEQIAKGKSQIDSEFRPDKSQYRKFKIKTVTEADDYQMMAEVIRRRFNNNWSRPDLVIIDGGKGHLAVVKKVLAEKKINIPVIAIAKGRGRKKTEVFGLQTTHYKLPTELMKSIQAEMHRFAIAYHRKRAEIGMREEMKNLKQKLARNNKKA